MFPFLDNFHFFSSAHLPTLSFIRSYTCLWNYLSSTVLATQKRAFKKSEYSIKHQNILTHLNYILCKYFIFTLSNNNNVPVFSVPVQSSPELVSKSGLPLIVNSFNGRCNQWHKDINLSDYTHRSHLAWMLPTNHKINNHLLLTSSSVCGNSLITSSISCITSLWLFRVCPKGVFPRWDQLLSIWQ